MKIQVTQGQVWWIALPDEIRPVRGIDAQVIGGGLKSLFNFPEIPVQKDNGAEFLNGRFGTGDDLILIEKLAIFTDGINVLVPTDTKDAETVLQVALNFFYDIGVRRPTTPPLHIHQSTIIADFDAPFENILPSSLMKKISNGFALPGTSSVFSLATNFDPLQITDARWRGINPSLFKIDRRVSTPYEQNRYFCLASMKSEDHIDVLRDFEKFALDRRI